MDALRQFVVDPDGIHTGEIERFESGVETVICPPDSVFR
jgi:hypothetical protein